MAEPQIDSKKLNEIRGNVLQFALKLGELRRLLRTHIDREDVTVNRLNQVTGISWGAITGLIHGTSAITTESKVHKLAQLVGMDGQAAADVAALGPKVPYRYMGLLFLDSSVIRLVFDLLVAHNGLSSDYTVATFSKAFAPHDQIVFGACNCNKEALRTLQSNPAIADAILDILLDEKRLQLKLEEIKKGQRRERDEAIAEIDRRVQKLLPSYNSKVDLVRALGLSSGSLDPAKLANASDVQVEKFLAVLDKAIEEQNPPGAAKEDVQGVSLASPPSDAITEEISLDPFNGLAGETIQGVQHVLTADNFRQIEGMSAEALVEALVTSAQVTIGLLTLVTQMRGEEIRLLMQRPKTRHAVRELYNAIEVSSAKDPSPLLAMFDEQRALQWNSLPNTTRKGDAK